MFKSLSYVSILALMTAFAGSVHAQAQNASPEEDIPEIVVTASGYGVNRDAVLSQINLLKRDSIATKPAGGLGDMLAYLPGVRSSGFAPGASRPVMRGLDGFRVMVLNNGMGMVDVSALSPDHATASEAYEAKQIEVVRGSAAMAYGGNAIGGVVNIIDDRISQTPAQNGLEGRVTLQGSSVDNGQFGGLVLKGGQGPLVFSFDWVHRQSDDYDTPVGPESRYQTESEGEDPDQGRKQENVFVDVTNWGAGVSLIGESGFVGLAVKKSDSQYGVPGHHHEGEAGVSIGMEQTRYDFRAGLKGDFWAFNRLTLDAGKTDYQHTEFEGADIGTQFFTEGQEARLNLIRDNKGALKATLGFVVVQRNFEAIGDEAFVPSTDISESAVYGQTRFDKGAWGLDAGARFDKKRLKTTTDRRDFSTFSASVGAFWRPSDHNFYGLSLTRSERAPSEAELFANGPHVATSEFVIGNRNFDTEVGTAIEATGHWTIDAHSGLALDVHAYQSHFDRFIDIVPTGNVVDEFPEYIYVATDADLSGLEVELMAPLGSYMGRDYRIMATYDYVKGDTATGPLGRIAPQALGFELTSEGDGLTTRLETRFVGDRHDRLREHELPTDGYTVVNLYVAYDLPDMTGLKVFAEVRNLGNAEMREATSATKDLVVGPARSFRVGLDYSF